jgi:PAS domain S-box-containing protein
VAEALDPARALDQAIDALPGSLLVVDADRTIMLANRELELLFGYAREELVGRTVGVLLPEANPGDDGELCGRRKDGTSLTVVIDWRLLHTSAGGFAVATLRNVSRSPALDDPPGAALAEQLAFERFITELGTQFINLPNDQLADAMRAGLRRSCELLGMDRGVLYSMGEDGTPAPISWTSAGDASNEDLPVKARFPWSVERIDAGETVAFSTPGEIPCSIDRASYTVARIASAVTVPLRVAGRVAAAVTFSAAQTPRAGLATLTHRTRVIAACFAQVLARRQREHAMQATTAEARQLKEQLLEKTVHVRRDVRERSGMTRVVGQSAALRVVLEKIQQVAAMDSTVLLLGETGTGKELLASQIHDGSSRKNRQMIRVNCAAIPTTLIESELFGREKGAFTGSLARQIGRFEMADHSTLFLDEVGDVPAEVQVKLLRVLEERKFERLGSPRSITVDTRIIAATHRNLETLMADGRFREDLYYRLSVFPIYVPSLRERAEDIPLLVWRFVEEFSKAFGKTIESIDAESIAALQQYSWPGNIRELRNVVERAMIVATSPRLTITPPHASASALRRSAKLVDVEKEHIRAVVESTGWRIRGVGGAADKLGLPPTTLEARMAKLGLKRPHAASVASGHRSAASEIPWMTP